MRTRIPSLVLVLLLATAAVAAGQCILANPSFEIGGEGGAVFGGWNQFGIVGTSDQAAHGQLAARLQGPDDGNWSVSGYWQRLDTTPGQRWDVTGHVLHAGAMPLVGESIALVNVEWRDAGGDLISYDSFAVATAASETDTFLDFTVTSTPAPAGAAVAHLLLGVLQSPTDPQPEVIFDQVTFFSATAPTIDDLQWLDFPGGRVLDFAGRTWRVKGPGYYGPGPNVFSDSEQSVWVDDDGLHLTLAYRDGNWTSTEIVLEEPLGYGDYVITTASDIDAIDRNAVLGLFLWSYGPCWDPAYLWWNAFNEIDIEYSRWSDPARAIGQFVAQPADWPGNLERFDFQTTGAEVTSHAMRWLPDRVEYRAWRGGPDDESAATMIHTWTYTGPHISRPEEPRLHLNLWKLEGTVAGAQEVVIQDVRFEPEGSVVPVEDHHVGLPSAPVGRLTSAAPNPFNPRTTIRFELARAADVALEVYDVRGQRVRTLLSGSRAAGTHEFVWDGRSDAGVGMASGTYLVQLRGAGFVDSQSVVLLK